MFVKFKRILSIYVPIFVCVYTHFKLAYFITDPLIDITSHVQVNLENSPEEERQGLQLAPGRLAASGRGARCSALEQYTRDDSPVAAKPRNEPERIHCRSSG